MCRDVIHGTLDLTRLTPAIVTKTYQNHQVAAEEPMGPHATPSSAMRSSWPLAVSTSRNCRNDFLGAFLQHLLSLAFPTLLQSQNSDREVEHSLERQLFAGGTMALAPEELKYLNHIIPLVGFLPILALTSLGGESP